MTTWTPKTEQTETWNASSSQRVFDPAVFDNNPIFDTGQAGGYWRPKPKEAETWTEA